MTISNTAHPESVTTRRGLRLGALAATVGTFAGLSGLVAPTVSAQDAPDVGGAIAVEYEEAAAANEQRPGTFFGPATSEELPTADGVGRFQTFENGNNAIYWHPNVSDGRANQIGGAVRNKWGAGEWEQGALGYPTTREWSSRDSAVSGEAARGNHFQGGSVYSVAGEGTYTVWGLIRTAWFELDAESSRLGLPTSDEQATDRGWSQDFEGGTIEIVDNHANVNLNDNAPTPEPGDPGFDLEEALGESLGDIFVGLS